MDETPKSLSGNVFTLRKEHIELAKRLSFTTEFDNWAGDEITPAIDAKRPFGNEGTTENACEILGFKDEDGKYSSEDVMTALTLLAELPLALAVILKYGSFSPGTYDVGWSAAKGHVASGYRYLRFRPAFEEMRKNGVPDDMVQDFAELLRNIPDEYVAARMSELKEEDWVQCSKHAKTAADILARFCEN